MLKDETGNRYGSLLVVSRAGRTSAGAATWNAVCDCGVARIVVGQTLRFGDSTSCGCSVGRRDLRYTAWKTFHPPTYSSWNAMRARCGVFGKGKGPSAYEGRGIRVCERWAASFDQFVDDMGLRPSRKHSIDRIDVDGNYEPGNCRWVTRIEQANNRRDSVFIEHNGQRRTATEWGRELGISHNTIRSRIRRGWTGSRTLS